MTATDDVLSRRLLDRAARDPDTVVATVTCDGSETELTAADLASRALGVARALASAGVRPGDVVPVAVPTSVEHVVAVFGALLRGAAVAPVAHLSNPTPERARAHAERLASVARCSGARLAVVPREAAAALVQVGATGPALLAVEELAAERADTTFAPESFDDDRIALVQFSSGSTAEPKGVRVRYRHIAVNAAAIARRSGVTAEDRMLCFLPLYHDFGFFTGIALPTSWDVPVWLFETTAFVRRPSFWPRAMSRLRATLCPAPQFAYDVALARIRDVDLEGVDLSAWRVSYNGGEPVRAATVRAFHERFAPYGLAPTVVLPSYGMAEATLAIAIHPSGMPAESDVISRDTLVERGRAVPPSGDEPVLEVSACGPSLDDVEVTVLDDDGAPLEDRVVGEIAIRGPSVADAYVVGPDRLEPLATNGWFRTGDLGYVARGRVFVTGRAKDMVIRGGANYYPQDVERSIERLRGARLNGVVAFGYLDQRGAERVAAVIELDPSESEAAADLPDHARRTVFDNLGLLLDDVVVERRGWIPRTTSAKLQRSLSRDRFLRERSSLQPDDRF